VISRSKLYDIARVLLMVLVVAVIAALIITGQENRIPPGQDCYRLSEEAGAVLATFDISGLSGDTCRLLFEDGHVVTYSEEEVQVLLSS
jgi:hypothetical protein